MTSTPSPRPHDHGAPHGHPGSPAVPGSPDFDARWWEDHYRTSGVAPAGGPSAHLVAEVAEMPPGTALDAGCGTGADALWLAGRGWQVTAVDVSPTAVQQAKGLAARQPELAGRISWLVADLGDWEQPRQYDLVVSQYVHPDLPFGEFVTRLARAVLPGGTLLVVGHHADDHHSSSRAPRDASIRIDTIVGRLDPSSWTVAVAENRTRQVAPGGTEMTLADVVVKAHRSAG